LRYGLLVLAGKGSANHDSVREWKPENFEVHIGSSVWDAGKFLELCAAGFPPFGTREHADFETSDSLKTSRDRL
jgi:hypothetical protein